MNHNPLSSISVRLLNKETADEAVAKQLFEVATSGFKSESPWTIEQLLQTIKTENALIVEAQINHEIVGFIAASETIFEIDIYMVVVAAQYKKRSIGTQLFERLIEYAQTKELESLILETRASNAPAIALYERVGFKKVGLRKAYYSSPIEDAILMKHEF